MKVLVIYESMFGNTHAIAYAISAGLAESGFTVTTEAAANAGPSLIEGVDLLVVGGPTHARAMTRPNTRRSAIDTANRKPSEIALDPTASGIGIREWLASISRLDTAAAAFDTRIDAPPLLTGSAAKGIDRRLHDLGCRRVVNPESFLVTTKNHLVEGELQRSREWGSKLASLLVPAG